MPGGDGRGPFGQGPGTGRGRGGRGMNSGPIGGPGNRLGAGPGGDCVCPACGSKVPHTPGIPCSSIACSGCGSKMARG